MVQIEDAIERADRESFTKEPLKTLRGQIGSLIRRFESEGRRRVTRRKRRLREPLPP